MFWISGFLSSVMQNYFHHATIRKQLRTLKIHVSQTFSVSSCCWRNTASISPIIQWHLCGFVSVRSEPSRLVRQSVWEVHWLKQTAVSAIDSCLSMLNRHSCRQWQRWKFCCSWGVSRDAGLVPEVDNNVTGYVCVGWQEWVMCGECKMIIPPIAPWPPLNRQCWYCEAWKLERCQSDEMAAAIDRPVHEMTCSCW